MPNRNFTSPSPKLDKILEQNTEKLKPWLEKFLTHCQPQKRYQHYSILLNETLTNLNNLNSYENTYIYFTEIYLLQNQLFELVGHLDHEKDYDVNFLEPGFREQFYKHTLTMLHWCVTSLISPDPDNGRVNHYYGKSVNETLNVTSSSSLFSRHFVDVFEKPEETTSLIHTFDWVFAYLKLLLLPPAAENIQFHDIDHRKESKPIKSLKDLRGNPQDGQALATYIRLEISTWDDLAVTNFFTQNQHNFHAIKTYIHTDSSELFTHEKNEHNKTLMERLLCYSHSIEDESPEELIIGLKLLQESIHPNSKSALPLTMKTLTKSYLTQTHAGMN